MMYHMVVKRHVAKTFESVNNHDYATVLEEYAPNVHHRFNGDHAIGGERHDRDAMGQWFERLTRLFPTLKLTLRDVWVKGWPHNTTVITRWTATATLPDGSIYENLGVQITRSRWGKVLESDTNEDSEAVVRALKIIAAHGVEEALAEPIVA